MHIQMALLHFSSKLIQISSPHQFIIIFHLVEKRIAPLVKPTLCPTQHLTGKIQENLSALDCIPAKILLGRIQV